MYPKLSNISQTLKWNYKNMEVVVDSYSHSNQMLSTTLLILFFSRSYYQPQSPKGTSKDLQFWLFLLVTHYGEFEHFLCSIVQCNNKNQ